MIIEVRNKETETMFCNIEQGSPFKCIGDTDGITDYYIKTNGLSINAVKVDTGSLCEFRPDDMVIPVNGRFVVE